MTDAELQRTRDVLASLRGKTLDYTHTVAEDLLTAAEAVITKRWQDRIVFRLAERMERDLREGLPAAMPSDGQSASVLIRGLAEELRTAGAALEHAANRLKSSAPVPANQVWTAALRAKQVATEILGE